MRKFIFLFILMVSTNLYASRFEEVVIKDGTTGNTAEVIQNTDENVDLDNDYGLVTSSILYARVDGSISPIKIDESTHAIMTLGYEHHEIHAGNHYIVSHIDTDLDIADAAIEILIVTPNTTKWSHMLLDITGTARTSIDLYEGTGLTGGTGITAYNNNRNSGNTSGLTITHTPTGGSGDGTLIYDDLIGGTTSAQSRSIIGQFRQGNEWVLKQNESYLLRVDTLDDNNRISIKLNWYEHTDKN